MHPSSEHRGFFGAPLDVPHLSRAPFTLAAAADGSIAFDATATATSIAPPGRPLTPATPGEHPSPGALGDL